MTFSRITVTDLDAALDVIAPRLQEADTRRDIRIAADYVAGRINISD